MKGASEMILLYHKICKLQHDYNYIGVTPENFKYQLEYIKRYYEIVPLSQVKGDQIAITFDDGFRDFYTEVYPYLMKQGGQQLCLLRQEKLAVKRNYGLQNY